MVFLPNLRRNVEPWPRRRANSQPAPRARGSMEHVQVIPICFEDNPQDARSLENKDVRSLEDKDDRSPGLSSISRVMITNNPTSAVIKTPTKPTLPDKPKNIQLIKKKLENLKSANICSNPDLAQRTALLRNSNKLKNNPVIFLILAMQIG